MTWPTCPTCGGCWNRVSERPSAEQARTLGDTVDRGGAHARVVGGKRVSPNVRYVGDVLPSGRRVFSVSPTYYQCG